MAQSLRPSVAPNLPIGPVDYDQRYQDQLLNALRLYFRELDNFTQVLMANGGGRFISFPHISASDTTDQYATATNTPTKVLWNTLDSGLAFTLNPNSTATPDYRGVYKIDYSLQFLNTSTQINDVYVWLRLNGTDIPGSGSIFSVPNSHGGTPGAVVAYSSVTFTVSEIDEISLYWATNQAATSGGGTGVYMHAAPAQTTPFAMPSVLSAIGTITFVSGVTP